MQATAGNARPSVLYITYDGLLEPLGQSQVLAYLARLASDHRIHLISFEKRDDWSNRAERERVTRMMEKTGIVWHPLRYHKRPTAFATGWDVAVGSMFGLWIVLRNRIRIVHARSYVPSVIALFIKRLTGAAFIFDMRGFWADERVDGGLWPRQGRLYRTAKWFEKRFLLAADQVVSLTHAAVQELESFPYLRQRKLSVTVIPTCADLGRFHRSRDALRPRDVVLGYVGSAGTWYQFDAVVRAFRLLAQELPEARLLIINRNEHGIIRSVLDEYGVDPSRVQVVSAQHEEVPDLIRSTNAGIFFYKPSFSRRACAPTKLGEFLGCGVPCLSNVGVGDMAEILEGERVGVAISGFDDSALAAGIDRLLALCDEPGIGERCSAAARRHFSLEMGVARYAEIYRRLASESMSG